MTLFVLLAVAAPLTVVLASPLRDERTRLLSTLATEPEARAGPEFETLPELQEPASEFLKAYFAYSALVERRVREALALEARKKSSFIDWMLYNSMEGIYAIVARRARSARESPEAIEARERWEERYGLYRDAAMKVLQELAVDTSRTLVVVSKSDYLAYLVDLDLELALYYFPIAYGANPYGEEKLRFGDCRTPSSEEARIVSKYRINEPDMNGVWMGVQVPNPNRPGTFWSTGGNMGLHGTPFRKTLGMKASHGCVRMFKEDSIYLSRFVEVGTRAVIWP